MAAATRRGICIKRKCLQYYREEVEDVDVLFGFRRAGIVLKCSAMRRLPDV
jgi:hypothetical protein